MEATQDARPTKNPAGNAIHYLKIWPAFFEDIHIGLKRFEVRVNDRNYRVGDWLRLREFDPKSGAYTGREELVEVTYVTPSDMFFDVFGIDDEIVVLGIKIVAPRVPGISHIVTFAHDSRIEQCGEHAFVITHPASAPLLLQILKPEDVLGG
jgi:hypothetical protein